MRYAAPTDACKCGDCQLVPTAVVREWADQFDAMLAALKLVVAFGKVEQDCGDDALWSDDFREMFEASEAAIAKANSQ